MLQHLQRVGAAGIHAGKTDETVRREIDQLLDLVVGNNPAAVGSGQIQREQHQTVDAEGIHLGEGNFLRISAAAVSAGGFACHSDGQFGFIVFSLEYLIAEFPLRRILGNQAVPGGMNMYVNNHMYNLLLKF